MPGGVTRPCAPSAPWAASRCSSRARKGARVWDEDGNELPRLRRSLGAADPRPRAPAVVEAVAAQAPPGRTFGAPTRLEVELAETVAPPRARRSR